MLRTTQILLWRALALAAVALGAIGLILPIVPSVPFLIFGAWAGSKGWPALEARLLNHPHYGAHIRAWRHQGAISRNAKWLSSVMMVGSSTGLQFTEAPAWLRWGVPLFLLAAAVWIWSRPEPVKSEENS